jgi:hypothetical protein
MKANLQELSSATARKPEGESLRTTLLVLMHELEASLQGSRQALLALDLAGIERGTCDQLGLIGKMGGLWQQSAAVAASGAREAKAPDFRSYPSELGEEFIRSRNRILDALRLQAALLRRARRKLCVLANMLAGPTASYGPLLARNGTVPPMTWNWGMRS